LLGFDGGGGGGGNGTGDEPIATKTLLGFDGGGGGGGGNGTGDEPIAIKNLLGFDGGGGGGGGNGTGDEPIATKVAPCAVEVAFPATICRTETAVITTNNASTSERTRFFI
jgi:hypothetical protein